MGWLFGEYKDLSHPFGTDNPPPASPHEVAAVRELEHRTGRRVRDGDHVEWRGIINRRLEWDD